MDTEINSKIKSNQQYTSTIIIEETNRDIEYKPVQLYIRRIKWIHLETSQINFNSSTVNI